MERHLATCAACRQVGRRVRRRRLAASGGARGGAAARSPAAQADGAGLRRGERSAERALVAASWSPPSRRTAALTVVGAAAVVAAIALGIWGAAGRMAFADPGRRRLHRVGNDGDRRPWPSDGGGTPAVLTVNGLAAASQHQGLRGLAHPAARAHRRGWRSSAPACMAASGPPSSRGASPDTRASPRRSSPPEAARPPRTPRCLSGQLTES